MVIDGIGLNRDAVVNFVKQNKPSYPQFESWVKKSATKLDKASVEKLNAAISWLQSR
jgi:glycine betaine/choline ABC-type transport system substrate-binding protein